jgi:NMD protein affecting ribosome stability and mRNA decay
MWGVGPKRINKRGEGVREQEPRAHAKWHRDRQIEEVNHDPYLARSKPPEPALCPQCGVVYHRGRWQRAARPEKAHEHLCPACQRIKDGYPAGYVKLSGEFLGTHRDEIRHLFRNEEQREEEDHPLQRIMDIVEKGGVITVTTTDVHLARRIGEALHHAYQGKLDIKYSQDEYLVRVDWTR